MDLFAELEQAEFKEAFDEFDKVNTEEIMFFLLVLVKCVFVVVEM